MGVELLEIGVQMRKVVIFFIRVCYRIVSNHPFIVGMLCFLALLYRSFPFLFSALVSISPVIICTAILLATLLSFGHPNAPNTEREEKRVHDNNMNHIIEKESEDKVFDEAARFLYDSGSEQKNENEYVVEYQYSPIPNMDDNNNLEFDVDNDKSADSFDSKMVNIGSHPGSPWKQEEEEKDDESIDSGSDREESCSPPNASMANIIPIILDELHPLLDEDTPQPVTDFDAEFKHSKTNDSEDEFNDGVVNQGELEAADDENEDGDEEEDRKGEKFAITWTEDDQKNIMDLGSSELERNQRLESLIARRKEQKNMRELAERNYLLECVDLPFNVAPISTARKNPFDIPDDQNGLRLPPIPGSAPSILLPRRNPFDLPYGSGEEKPHLMEDSFQKEFVTLQPKEPFFGRHESFNVQSSLFMPNKRVKDDIRLRPYFVPERMEMDGTKYTPLERQMSDLSDSKVSFVPETESTGSVSDSEDKNLNDKDLVKENIIDQHISQEPDLMSSSIEHECEHVGYVPNFYVDELLELGRNGKDNIFGVGCQNGKEPFSTGGEFSLAQLSYTSFERKQVEEILINDEAPTLHSKHGGIDLLNLDTNKEDSDLHCQEDEELIAVGCQNGLEEKLTCQYDEELALLGTSMNNLPPRDHKEVQEPPLILVETVGKASDSVLLRVDEATREVGQSNIKRSVFDEVKVANHIQGCENHKVLLETVEYYGDVQHLIEDRDGSKDVDEELLSELDARNEAPVHGSSSIMDVKEKKKEDSLVSDSSSSSSSDSSSSDSDRE